jgi:hypothetical protein
MMHTAAVAGVILSLSALCVVLYTTCHTQGSDHQRGPFRVSIKLHTRNSTDEDASTLSLGQRNVFAYVMYATTEDVLCNNIINARRLISFGVTSEADIVLMHPVSWQSAAPGLVPRKLEILRGMQVRGFVACMLFFGCGERSKQQ